MIHQIESPQPATLAAANALKISPFIPHSSYSIHYIADVQCLPPGGGDGLTAFKNMHVQQVLSIVDMPYRATTDLEYSL